MPGNVSTTAATSAKNVDTKKTKEKRPSFEAIVEDTLSDSQLSASGKVILKGFLAWVKNTANPRVRRAILSQKVTRNDFKIYKKAFKEAQAEACKQNPPSRASFEKIIGKALRQRSLSAPGRNVLSALLQWVKITGNPVVKRAILTLNQKDYKIYKRCFYEAARKACFTKFENLVFEYRQKWGPKADKLLRADATAGYPTSALSSARKKIPTALKSVADKNRVVSAGINFADRHRPFPILKKGKFTLGGNLQVNISHNTRKSFFGELGAGLNPIYSPHPVLDLEAYGHFSISGAKYEDPNRYYFSGYTPTLTGGIAGTIKWKSGFLKLYAEYQQAWNRYAKEVYGSQFNGGMQAINLGIIFKQNLTSGHDLWIELSGTPWGRILLPGIDPDGNIMGKRFSGLYGVAGEVTWQGTGSSLKPWVSGGVSAYKQEHRDPMLIFSLSGGLRLGKERKYGELEGAYIFTLNPALYDAEDGDQHTVIVKYYLPFHKRQVYIQYRHDLFGRRSVSTTTAGVEVFRWAFPKAYK